MKINTQNTKKTKTIIFAAFVILLVAGAGGIFWWANSNSQKKNEKKEENTSKVEEKKEDSKKSEETKKQEAAKEIINSKTKNNNTDRAEGTVESSGYTNVQVEDGAVRVAGQISGLLYDDGNGKCSYTLTHSDGTKIELSTEILESPNNKYCKAVSKKISDSEFKTGK